MGLQDFFQKMFHSSEKMAVGKNRPYFLRSVELVKSLKGISQLGHSSQKALVQLYTELENVLRRATEASGINSRYGSDKHLNKMFDEATKHVGAFLQKHGDAGQAQEFTTNMKNAWTYDTEAIDRMSVMKGRIFQMMRKYEKMKRKTLNLFHWLQPEVPSIYTSDWVQKSLWSKYDVEDGITIEEFINRILTAMITQKASRFRDDLLLRNPRLYRNWVIEDNHFFNLKLRGERLVPEDMNKTLDKINGDELALAFDFGDGKESSLQDLIYQIFETNSQNFPKWLDNWTNVYWTRCPADKSFIWSDRVNPEKTCAYKDQEHEGHVIYRDPKGNMEHELILPHQIRIKPLSKDEKYQPTIATVEPVNEAFPVEETIEPASSVVSPAPSLPSADLITVPTIATPDLSNNDVVQNKPPSGDKMQTPTTRTQELVKRKRPAENPAIDVLPNRHPKPPAARPSFPFPSTKPSPPIIFPASGPSPASRLTVQTNITTLSPSNSDLVRNKPPVVLPNHEAKPPTARPSQTFQSSRPPSTVIPPDSGNNGLVPHAPRGAKKHQSVLTTKEPVEGNLPPVKPRIVVPPNRDSRLPGVSDHAPPTAIPPGPATHEPPLHNNERKIDTTVLMASGGGRLAQSSRPPPTTGWGFWGFLERLTYVSHQGED